MSLANRILAAKDLKEQEVTIPEWDNATVIVRSMNGAQRAQFMKDQEKGQYVAMVRALIGTVLDPETKKPAFEHAHQDGLLAKNASVLESLFTVLADLSSINPKSLEAAEKNSQPAKEDSTSSSPNSSIVQ